MAENFLALAFTPAVQAAQARAGSRAAYEGAEHAPPAPDRLGPAEAAFIAAADTAFLATVGETGWPYVQHRGGPAGFIRVQDPGTLVLPEFRGNRQYISAGNLQGSDRIALILVDFARQRRLKILGHARLVDDPALLADLALPGYRARVIAALVVQVAGFDWNCPAHITPRFTEAEIDAAVSPLRARLAALEAENAALRAR